MLASVATGCSGSTVTGDVATPPDGTSSTNDDTSTANGSTSTGATSSTSTQKGATSTTATLCSYSAGTFAIGPDGCPRGVPACALAGFQGCHPDASATSTGTSSAVYGLIVMPVDGGDGG
jgi:hypothetical protein